MKRIIHINRNGICYSLNKEKRVSKRAVSLCELWIEKFIIKRRKTLNKDADSYKLKHLVERYYGMYITNGALIQAAINSGFDIECVGPNAYFNMSMVNWNRFIKGENKRNKREEYKNVEYK